MSSYDGVLYEGEAIYSETEAYRRKALRRFFGKVEKGDGCWEWTAYTNHRGYGLFRVGTGERRRWAIAHRFSWELANNLIHDGLFVLHRCDNPKCVRPDHLFLGTHTDNMRDKVRKGRHRNGNGDKTHCKRGHEFTPENTKLEAWGSRRCLACLSRCPEDER